MALTDEEKLRNLASEALNDAAKISSEIEEKTKQEFQEQLEAGEKKLLADVYGYIQSEIEQIRRAKSLEVSQTNVRSRQEYFKYGRSVAERVLEDVSRRLKDFVGSEHYEKYLSDSCRNIIEKTGGEVDIFYMPKDESVIEKIQKQFKEQFKGNIKFKKDESINSGGLRFFNRDRNVMVNDVFDEKIERAKELLSTLIGPQFTAI